MFDVNAVVVVLLVMVWPQGITLVICSNAMNILVVLRSLVQLYQPIVYIVYFGDRPTLKFYHKTMIINKSKACGM